MNKPLFPDIHVNGDIIPSGDIAAEAQNHPAPNGKPGLAWKSGARALVIRALMLQEAARQGMTPQPKEVARGMVETNDEALVRQVMEQSVNPDAPSADAVRLAYEGNPEAWRSTALYEPAHILFAADPKDAEARAKARKRAEAALLTLQGSPGLFANLAADQSDCPSRDAGGRLGQIATGDTVPEFENVMADMQSGDIFPDPVETRFGFHVLRLDAKSEGKILPYDAVKDQISEALEKANWALAAKKFVDDLVADAEITGIDMGVAA